ncbi:MAG: hypothetical protein QME92_00085 [Bacillota bacterium]|nr:hypothetical protein [Bacillota bacterium]
MRRQVVEREKTMQQMHVEAFAECAWEHYSTPGRSRGNVEAAIAEARRLGSDRLDGYTMREGEKLFRRWLETGMVGLEAKANA